jgi:hypothetical protein
VGQYTQKNLKYYGLSEEELAAKGVITYGTNVKESPLRSPKLPWTAASSIRLTLSLPV